MFAADENAECALGDEVEAVAHLALLAGRAVLDEADGIEMGRQLGQGHPIDSREQIGLRQKFRRPAAAAILGIVPGLTVCRM